MNVTVLRKTDNPDRLFCQAARGDYYEGYIGDTEYADLMKNVSVPDAVIRDVLPQYTGVEIPDDADASEWFNDEPYDYEGVVEAKTRAFCEKQLSRGHFGPAEHAHITFAVEGVPVFTERQLIRHRHLSFDVQSMRYADFSDAPYTTPKSMTDPDHFSRETGLTQLDEATMEEAREMYEEHMDEAFEKYEQLVEMGIPKEDARGILGLGTEVNLTVSGNARSFLHLLDMRRKGNAQWSIRQLSEQLLDELFEWAPHMFNWYKKNGPNKLSP